MKKYILWVTTNHQERGISSHWHGWSRNLTLTYEEALKERKKIKNMFDEVEIQEIS